MNHRNRSTSAWQIFSNRSACNRRTSIISYVSRRWRALSTLGWKTKREQRRDNRRRADYSFVTMSIVVWGKSEEKWYRGLNKTRPIGYRQLNKEYRPGSMPSANVEAFVTCFFVRFPRSFTPILPPSPLVRSTPSDFLSFSTRPVHSTCPRSPICLSVTPLTLATNTRDVNFIEVAAKCASPSTIEIRSTRFLRFLSFFLN